jgi:hypothetical protein
MPFVFLELGALVGGNRVFQRQRMQAELVAQAGDGRLSGDFSSIQMKRSGWPT